MKMLLKIAWRNIWRNRSRSLTIIAAIIIGLTGAVTISGIFQGFLTAYFEEAVQSRVSHIQIHHPDFIRNTEGSVKIEQAGELSSALTENKKVKAFAPRTVIDGMAASANLTRGVQISGIVPEREAGVTQLNDWITEGTYFETQGRIPSVIIGEVLAEKLNVRRGSRMVLTFQNVHGDLVSASFSVGALYNATFTAFEERSVFVRQTELNALREDDDLVNEVALLTANLDAIPEVKKELSDAFPDLLVRDWADIAPEMEYQQSVMDEFLIWVVIIVLLGVGFGLLNTVLMSVFERTREIGMLMCIGMKKSKVFAMILLETTLLSLTGGVAGLLISYALISRLNKTGFDMGWFGDTDSLGEWGLSSFVYPDLDPAFYFQTALLVVLFAVLAAVYPARKAVKLIPADAVRK